MDKFRGYWNRLDERAKTAVKFGVFVGAVFGGLSMYQMYLERRRRKHEEELSNDKSLFDSSKLKVLLEHENLPAMICNLDTFDANVDAFARRAERGGVTLRLASKSIRVPWLIQRVLSRHPDVYKGLMCFSAHEAAWWVSEGVKDVLVAYPCTQEGDLQAAFWAQQSSGGGLVLMVDSVKHVELLARAWRKFAGSIAGEKSIPVDEEPRAVPFEVAIDLDASLRLFGGAVHIGAHRSWCRTLQQVSEIAACIRRHAPMKLVGIMSYEAQVSGLPDMDPSQPLISLLASVLKPLSMAELARRRAAVASLLHGFPIRFFNGGGSGSIEASAQDKALTEVAVGSGLVQSCIFDLFNASFAKPAIVFALRVTRSCDPDIVTCQSGGFIASGETDVNKSPRPFIPLNLAPFPPEGYGEVQTPLRILPGSNTTTLRIGDPVFFRPAKAGEIAERFQEYIIVDTHQDRILRRAPTYRGLGLCFY